MRTASQLMGAVIFLVSAFGGSGQGLMAGVEYRDRLCESKDSQYAECSVGGSEVMEITEIYVKQQHSKSPCFGVHTLESHPDQDWSPGVKASFGYNGNKIWVQKGCRAEFTAIVAVSDPLPPPYDPGASCSSWSPQGWIYFFNRGYTPFDQRLIEVSAPVDYTWVLLGTSNGYSTSFHSGPTDVYKDSNHYWHWTFTINDPQPMSQVYFVVDAVGNDYTLGKFVASCAMN